MTQLAGRALCIAALGLAASWLLLSGNSPLANSLVNAPLITNIASAANLPTMLFGLAGFPGTRAPTDGSVALVGIVQWLVYGLAIAWIWRRLWPNNSFKPTPPHDAA